jgi:hypothetical protein
MIDTFDCLTLSQVLVCLLCNIFVRRFRGRGSYSQCLKRHKPGIFLHPWDRLVCIPNHVIAFFIIEPSIVLLINYLITKFVYWHINYVGINIIQQHIFFLLMRVGRTFFETSGSRILMIGNSGLAYINVGIPPPTPSLMLEKIHHIW